MNYYNEFDPKIAAWLRQLIATGHIPAGEVDERSIEDVKPGDMRGFVQCHFFAGIGGWSHALDLAGWPRDRPIWTGSCPCQPFSAAGKGAGFEDERHLWPAWQHLVAQCRPPTIFGEQVASKAADPWLDLVQSDLENMGYSFGCIPFPSAGVGAPHIRDRNFWMGHAISTRLEGHGGHGHDRDESGRLGTLARGPVAEAGAALRLADPDIITGRQGSEINGRRDSGSNAESQPGLGGGCDLDGLADPNGRNPSAEREQRSGEQRQQPQDGFVAEMDAFGRDRERMAWASALNGFWRNADWLRCRDEKWRPVECGTFPLVDGLPKGMVRGRDAGSPFHPSEGRVMRLRGYGNAINPHQAAEFIQAAIGAI